MANTVVVQLLQDGPRNVIAKVDVDCTSANISNTVILDPATLSATFPPSDQLRVENIQFSVKDGWLVNLWWEATTAKRIISIAGRGWFAIGEPFGGWLNNSGAGRTGAIMLSTSGYPDPAYPGGDMAASIVIHCIKEANPLGLVLDTEILTESLIAITTETSVPLYIE